LKRGYLGESRVQHDVRPLLFSSISLTAASPTASWHRWECLALSLKKPIGTTGARRVLLSKTKREEEEATGHEPKDCIIGTYQDDSE